MVRQAASQTLNYADTLPNCLRLTFHDSSERYNNSGGCVKPLLFGLYILAPS